MRWILFAAILVCSVGLAAQEITVAAAADLQFALKDIAQQYQSQTGQPVKMIFGSSGNLYAAIQNGAPYDVFFSADTEYAKKLGDEGLAQSGSLYEYALGRLVLWAPQTSKIDVSRGMDLLTTAQVRKIAIANPRHAPYGRAAEQALKSAGIYERVHTKLVLGENISQTAQFVQSGNADVGLVSLSLVIPQPGKKAAFAGKYWIVPSTMYDPVRQAAVVIKGRHEEAGQRFLNFVKSQKARAVLQQYGFGLPQG